MTARSTLKTWIMAMLFGVETFTLPSSGKICFHMVEAFTVIPFPTLGIARRFFQSHKSTAGLITCDGVKLPCYGWLHSQASKHYKDPLGLAKTLLHSPYQCLGAALK